MAATIYVITALAAFAGIGFAVWTFIDTRNKYYNDFVKRKSDREKLRLP